MTQYQPNEYVRMIGIDADYVQTTDFALEKGDKEFLLQVFTIHVHLVLIALLVW
jgi:hypothetical protein